MMDTQQQQKILGAMLRRKQNSFCADCGGKSPCWASLDFGVFVCLNCSGGHRALGPSVTRVKSTKLDTWNRDWLENMQVGNAVLNEYWQHGLQSLTRTVKPNVNTSIKEIIRYVEDKYLRRKYVDRGEEMDPLTRFKKYPGTQMGEGRGKQQNVAVRVKQVPRVVVKEPVQTHHSKQSDPFATFQSVNSEKKLKRPVDNLISFEESAPKKEQGNFGFDLLVPEQKNDKTQFHSTGNTTSPPSVQIDFDSLLKIKPTEPATVQHPNHFISAPFGGNTHASHSTPQFDKNQYVTMNINMNMYPKVVNINMNQPQYGQYNPYLPAGHGQQQNVHSAGFNQRGGYVAQEGGFGLNQNAGLTSQAGQFLSSPATSKQSGVMNNITLDSTINLETANKPKTTAQSSSSWADDWK